MHGVEGAGPFSAVAPLDEAQVGWVRPWLQFWTCWSWDTCESSKKTQQGSRQIFNDRTIRGEVWRRDVNSHLFTYVTYMWVWSEARWVDEMGKSVVRWPRTSLEELQQWVTLKRRMSLQRRVGERPRRAGGESEWRVDKGGRGQWGGNQQTCFISFLILGRDEQCTLPKVVSGSKWNMTYAKG